MAVRCVLHWTSQSKCIRKFTFYPQYAHPVDLGQASRRFCIKKKCSSSEKNRKRLVALILREFYDKYYQSDLLVLQSSEFLWLKTNLTEIRTVFFCFVDLPFCCIETYFYFVCSWVLICKKVYKGLGITQQVLFNFNRKSSNKECAHCCPLLSALERTDFGPVKEIAEKYYTHPGKDNPNLSPNSYTQVYEV